MENPNKSNGYNGTTAEEENQKLLDDSVWRPPVWDYLLRLLATVLTLTAALISGLASQTRHIPLTQDSTAVHPLTIAVTAKGRYLSSTMFFMATNCIACGYGAVSCAVSMGGRREKGGRAAAAAATAAGAVMYVGDVMMVAVLAAAAGAAAGVGRIAYRGNGRLRWNAFCDVFGGYCQLQVVALVLTLAGVAVFIALLIRPALTHLKQLLKQHLHRPIP